MPDFDDHLYAQELADIPGTGDDWEKAAWPRLHKWLTDHDDQVTPRELEPWAITLEALSFVPRNQIWVDAVARLLGKQREAGVRFRLRPLRQISTIPS